MIVSDAKRKRSPGFCRATKIVRVCKDSTAMRLLYTASIESGPAVCCMTQYSMQQKNTWLCQCLSKKVTQQIDQKDALHYNGIVTLGFDHPSTAIADNAAIGASPKNVASPVSSSSFARAAASCSR
eukprot:12953-Heterococcus_DN1.PRE.1